ncbi:hypothetical protein Tco_1003203 [Tanacetum coccineum]|uniref:Uncharacterized protein n=1 Tax=Tanacetum coccineum TaxID=301880 RepID=A0ABQ5F9S8_9ASTR
MESIWIMKFIYGLRVIPGNEKPMDIYCDIYGAIIIAKELGVHEGAEHYQRNVHRLRILNKEHGVCITGSSTNELFTPYKDPEQEFRSSRRHFRTLSLDELRSPDFNLFSDQENSEEEEAETMAETMEQYMSKTRADYGSGVVRPKIKDKDNFELKGQFLMELRTNTFNGSDHEDANEHIEKVLEIVDIFHIPNITIDQVMLRAFPMPLTRAASRWLRNKPTGSITTWEETEELVSKPNIANLLDCKEIRKSTLSNKADKNLLSRLGNDLDS